MKTLLWIVIGIIVIAFLASLAFSARDDDASMATTTAELATTTMTAADLAQVRAEAAADLTALRVRAEAGENYAELADEYAVIRARVAAAYAAAGEAAADEWQDVEAGFDSFEASARAGGSAALDGFASLIARFSADVRTDSPEE